MTDKELMIASSDDKTMSAEKSWTAKQIDHIIAHNIRHYRKRATLTQHALAERIGVQQGLIAAIENVRAGAGKNILVKIAKALDIPEIQFYQEVPVEADQLRILDKLKQFPPQDLAKLEAVLDMLLADK